MQFNAIEQNDSYFEGRLTGALVAVFAFLLTFGSLDAQAARMDLPTANEVIPGKAMRLDGEYRISTINKRVLIDRGRAIVIDGWKHMFLWDVVPGMVVIKDIRYRGDGVFTGRDLPLKSSWRGKYNERDGSLNVVAGNVKYKLIPVGSEEAEFEEEYVEPQPERVPADRIGNASLPKVSKCPGGQSYLSDGQCWSCPRGFKRASLTRKMNHPRACESRGFGKSDFIPATLDGSKRGRCPSGTFHFAEQGINGCYQCPEGYHQDRSSKRNAVCMLSAWD